MAKNNGLGKGLVVLLSFVVLFGCSKDGLEDVTMKYLSTGDEIILPIEEKIYWNGTINDNFDDSTVIVVLDKNLSGINKVHDKNIFGNIDIVDIEDLTYVTDIKTIIDLENFQQVLLITLSINSKNNVIKAVRHLEKIAGIVYVGPNRIEAVGG